MDDVLGQIDGRQFRGAPAVEDVPLGHGVGVDLVEVALDDETVGWRQNGVFKLMLNCSNT